MSLHTWGLATATGALAILVGCTSASNTASSADAGSSSGSSPSGPETGAANLTCLGVLQCAASCPDESVDACSQACLDRTSTSSQPVTSAFTRCLTDQQCTDADCVKAKCADELAACVADDASAAQGEPSTGPASTTGSVPAELVGLWSQVGTSSGMSYQFEADGTTTQVFKSKSDYYCTSELDLTSSGVTNVTGNTLVYHRAEGTQVTTSCDDTTSKAVGPADLTYRYTLGTSDDGTPVLSLALVAADGSVGAPFDLHR